MADTASRMETATLKRLSSEAERLTENLVINRQMDDKDVHWHRGYVAALRDHALWFQKELPKIINEVRP